MDLRIRRQNIFTKLFYRQKTENTILNNCLMFSLGTILQIFYLFKNHNIPKAQIDYVCDYINPIFKNKKYSERFNK